MARLIGGSRSSPIESKFKLVELAAACSQMFEHLGELLEQPHRCCSPGRAVKRKHFEALLNDQPVRQAAVNRTAFS